MESLSPHITTGYIIKIDFDLDGEKCTVILITRYPRQTQFGEMNGLTY